MIPGTQVAGRYVVLRALGEGGMGQVFEVQHRALGRRFALKVLRADLVNGVLIRRFEREAQALARVSTARVAQVTDFGIDPEIGPFYVMELLDGETLGDRLDREGRLSLAEAAEIAIEVAEALVEVHEASLVHRDLKPSNIGLPFRGPVKAKLLDFGLAAVLDSGNPRLTKSQELLGSLPYMAPEQFMGSEPTPAIDLYALGVCAYEMMTGRLPFDADSSAALMHQILTQPVPPLDDVRLGIAVPGPLAAVVLRLLAREAGGRYPSARAAAQALRAAAVGPSRERTLQDNEDAAMPHTRPTPVRAAPADGLAPTEESPSLPPPRPPSGEEATLLVAATVLSDDGAPGDTWRAGPPPEVVAAELARARAERRLPSTSEVPAAIRTTSVSVAGLRSARHTAAWVGAIVAIGAVILLALWLARRPGETTAAPAGARGVPAEPAAPPVAPAASTPPPPPTPAGPPPAATLPVGVAPPPPVAPVGPGTTTGPASPAPAAPIDTPVPAARTPVAPVAPGPGTRQRTKRSGRPPAGGGWSGEIIERP